MHHPLLLSSEFDPFQMAIIVIAVIAGFVKWLWENWQQKRDAMPAPPPDPEERRLREAAWRKQTGQASAPPPLPPVVAPSPWDELRKAWKELQETARPTPARQVPARTPPPMPAQRQQQPQRQRSPQTMRAAPAQPAPAAVASRVPAATPAVIDTPPAVVVTRSEAPAGSFLATVRHLRRDPALMRQAILMQEILGPPKALQSSGDFAI